jgi:hypothetical protein
VNEELRKRMETCQIDIRSERYYETIDTVRSLYRDNMQTHLSLPISTPSSNLHADQQLIKILDKVAIEDEDSMLALDVLTKQYTQYLNTLAIRDHTVKNFRASSASLYAQGAALLAGFPIFVYGAINNLINYKVPEILTLKVVKHPKFKATVTFVLGMFITPLCYIIQPLIVAWLSGSWLIALVYLISLPITGIFAFSYYIKFIKLRSAFKLYNHIKKNIAPATQLPPLRARIVQALNKIVANN